MIDIFLCFQVDLRYKNIGFTDFDIRIKPVGFVIADVSIPYLASHKNFENVSKRNYSHMLIFVLF